MVTARFTGCLGQNSAVDPARCSYNADTGTWESPLLQNVDLEEGGRLERRKGFTSLQPGSWHSLWGNGDLGYVVNGSTLYEINEAGVLLAIKTDMLSGFKVSYVAVDGVVYWCNSGQKGKIVDHQAEEWGGIAYPHPGTVRQIGAPPVGHLVEYFAGRLYIAMDNVVYFTEGAGQFDFVDMQTNHLPFYDSTVWMLKAVDDGLYVGSDAGVEFVSGSDPERFQYRRVTSRRPVPGTAITMNGDLIDDGIGGTAALWVDTLGVSLGVSGGTVRSLTKDKFIMPAASSGCGLHYDNKFVALLAP